MNVGRRILEYLNENGISQTFVSKKTGIPLPKLNLSLNGHRKLGYDEYAAICWCLNVNTDHFIKPAPLSEITSA